MRCVDVGVWECGCGVCGGEGVNMRLLCVKRKTETSVKRARWGVEGKMGC